MAFELDYSNTTDSGILPEGEYECVIKRAFLDATKGGTEYFNVQLVIRNDVPQKYKNRYIFFSLWRRREGNRTADDLKIGGFSFKQVMSLCKAAGLKSGSTFSSMDELGEQLVGKPVLVILEHTEYKGELRESVKYTNASEYPQCNHIFKAKATPIEEAEVSPDDDLPF